MIGWYSVSSVCVIGRYSTEGHDVRIITLHVLDYNASPRRGVHILFHNQRAREMESERMIEGRGKILDQK